MEKTYVVKAGLEIHQQLDAGKLFCSCPGILRQDEPDYLVERKFHIIAGEQGSVDEAVKFEAGKDRKIIYQGYYDNCCLVELDEEPPHQINQEALKIALQISLLLNCEIVPYSQIMRKTVIDGSNVSGFQRTVLIGRNGYVETSFGRVRIKFLLLEEDAARIVSQDKDKSVYKLDRLGMPLVEIATEPDIKNSGQAKEAALHIGEILRACKVKRGIGTIRQDVNVSLKLVEKATEIQGARIEMKGVQEPSLIIKTIENEIERQKKLIKQGKSTAEVRKANEDGTTSFLRPMPGSARMYPETDLPLLHISRELINQAKNSLPRLKKEIKSELKAEGLSDEMIKLILDEGKISEYKELLGIYNNPNLIAKVLVLWKKEILSREKIADVEKKLSLDILESILVLVRDRKISEGDAKNIMIEIANGKKPEDAMKIERVEDLEDQILAIVKEKPGLSVNAYMGLVMGRLKGKVNGKEVIKILEKLVK